jgi:hypothetical protein
MNEGSSEKIPEENLPGSRPPLTDDENWRAGYRQAFDDILEGQSLDKTKAKILSAKNEPLKDKWSSDDWGKFLTIITSLVVAISGIIFSTVQISIGW